MSLVDQPMRLPEHPTQIRVQLKARLARLASDQPLLAATLTQVHKRCGRKTCRCQTHAQLHAAWHLTYPLAGKTRTVYVPHDLLDDVRSWIDNHKRHKSLLTEVHQLTVALIKTHTKHKRRQAGRP
jgi:hypothetical protein